jgi:hypothetical protein
MEMISFDGADSGKNSDVLVSILLDVGTFVERLWNVCSFTVLILLIASIATEKGIRVFAL